MKNGESALPVMSGKRALPGIAQAGGGHGDVRQSRHHRIAVDGRLRGRAQLQAGVISVIPGRATRLRSLGELRRL